MFSLSKIKDKQNINLKKNAKNSITTEKYIKKHYLRIKNIAELIKEPPSKNEIYHIATRGDFNAFSLVVYFIDLFGNIDELTTTTFNIGKKITHSLNNFIISNKIGKLNLVINEMVIKKNKDVYTIIENLFYDKTNINVAFAWNHSKVSLLKIKENYFVIEGSGNWTENARYEQYIIANSKQLYLHHYKWINEVINEKQ